jgi:hypothetical protein
MPIAGIRYPTRGYRIAIAGIGFWSTTGIFIRLLTETYDMPALVVAFWRNILVCVAIALVLLIFYPSLLHLENSQIPFYAIYGLILSLFNVNSG